MALSPAALDRTPRSRPGSTALRLDPETRRAALDAARDMVPILLGVAPFAVVIGVAIQRADIDRLGGWAASLLLCAGTAQLTTVDLLDQGVAPIVIVGTVALINSRFALYSATFARWFADEPLHRRLLFVFPLVDQLFALCTTRFERMSHTARERRAYYVTAAVLLVVWWVSLQALAVQFASSIPDTDWLGLTAPLAFVGLLMGAARDRSGATSALTGAAVSVAAASVAPHLALIAGIAAGVGAGSFLDRRSS